MTYIRHLAHWGLFGPTLYFWLVEKSVSAQNLFTFVTWVVFIIFVAHFLLVDKYKSTTAVIPLWIRVINQTLWFGTIALLAANGIFGLATMLTTVVFMSYAYDSKYTKDGILKPGYTANRDL